MTDIVLAVPAEGAASFQRATEAASEEVAARVREWSKVTLILDGVAYIPLRTDGMPPKERKTADGVEMLLAGRWPGEVQQAIVAGQFARVSGRVVGEFWEKISCVATYGLSGEWDGKQSAAPEVAQEPMAGIHEQMGTGSPFPVDAGDAGGVLPSEDVPRNGDVAPIQDVDQQNPSHAPAPEEVVPAAEPVIPDAEIAAAEPWTPDGTDTLTPIVKRLEHYGARFWSGFFDQPIETVREGLRAAAREERVVEAHRREREQKVAAEAAGRVEREENEAAMARALYTRTDAGNADRMVATYGEGVRFCATFGAWYVWNGRCWERDETRRILALATEVARGIYREAQVCTDADSRQALGKWAAASESLSRRKAMIEGTSPYVAVVPEDLDARPTLLNCQNGTLELDTLVFREARREDLLTKCCGVDYDPAATCPGWLAHLDLIFNGDAEVIGGFQQMAGYSLLDGNPEQVMFILLGRGKNGKSVTLRVLSEVLGDYAINIAAESLMLKRNDAVRSDLARLKGARLATSAEGGEGALLDEGVVKQLTGFEDKITVRRLYEQEFEFTPTMKIWFATNHAPKIRGTDDGIWRRIWLIPFEVQIPEEQRDPRITERLLEERAGILNWMVDGLRQYHAQGRRLRPSDKVLAATAQFRSESDVLGRFVAQEMRVDPLGTIERAVLYDIYTKWCSDEGERPVSRRTVGKYLRGRGYGERKMGGAWCWTGIRIKRLEEEVEDEPTLQMAL